MTLTPDVRPEDTERVAREIERRLGLRARPDPLKPVRRLRVVVGGPEDVDALRREFPDLPLVCDTKTMDAGRGEMADAPYAGAPCLPTGVPGLGGAPD